ncbi:DUF6090 family protein [Robiginitalea sp. SC105]|uniref:DUF6090 family protein n=1 Tax=Robiginitalea sp. SC105 TaxID=2762332 RepID=UPI00163A4E5E|nr:DUF6090 family protein [Robiginitalea sp. SC105]MBC2839847.1 hypothetical protein [Robiginitalea sp. SC105]
MFRFFRQIRQRLLTDNKFSKYLLYAVGEILLVVIGILIALQVDNWNNKREDRLREEILVKNIIQDLTDDGVTLNQLIQQALFKQNIHLQLYDATRADSSGDDGEIFTSEYLEYIDLVSQTWDNHRNSPQLISDLEIRNQLNRYLSDYQKAAKYVDISNGIVTEARDFNKEYDLLNLEAVFRSSPDNQDFDPSQLLDSEQLLKTLRSGAFDQVVVELFLSTQDALQWLNNLLRQNETLVASLNTYLDKLNKP